MRKLLFILLVWLYPIFSFGGINEYLTDVYFANGILTDEGNATANTELLRNAILFDTYQGVFKNFKKDIGDVYKAYNSTHGSYWDFIESAAEKWGMQWLKDKLWDTVHKADLDLQIKHYQESIRLGHKVLAVAHSQGNLFTNDAYKAILGDNHDWWMTPYFKIVSVASPMHFMITLDTPEISWDNDLVADLGLDLMSGRTYSPVRKIKWKFYDGIPIASRVERPRHNYVYSYKVNEIYKGSWKPVEGLLQKFDSNVHAFTFYMDKPIKDGNTGEIFYNPFDENKMLQTDIAKTKIMTAIKTQLDNLKKVTSQWEIKKEIGCICKEKYVEMTHKHNPEKMDILLKDKKVKNFTSVSGGKSKIYAVTLNGKEQYVRASFGGASIEEISEDNSDLCYQLKNDEATVLGEIRGIKIPSLPGQDGALQMTLSWNYQCDIDMDLTMEGNAAVVYDIKDVEGVGKEHLVIPSLYDIKPGDHYSFKAVGKQLPESTATDKMLAEDPIEIRALLETTKGNFFHVWPLQSFSSLNLGTFAEVWPIEDTPLKWVCPAVSDVPNWYRPYNRDTGHFQCLSCSAPYRVVWKPARFEFEKGTWYCNMPNSGGAGGGSGRTYNECDEEEKKNTCGCVPCEYIVASLQKRVENGPIVGAKVEIIKASDADSINPEVLYRGSTTDKDDLFKSGLLEITVDTLALFEDDVYYLVSAQGGKDIDRNDDMVRDAVPTDNHGTIHALIKGTDLKKLPFRVNILTEAIYQVSGEGTGYHYDAAILEEKLDDAAQKLLSHKLYPGDDNKHINYKDILLWTPAVDKKALYKPFATYAEPIIDHVYANTERFDESYRLIYEPYESSAPQLEPLALEIPEGLADASVIAQVKTGNKKVFDRIVLQGNFSEHFRVDGEGYIHIAQSHFIEEGNRYRLLMKAVDAMDEEGSFVSLTIAVNGKLTQGNPTKSRPVFTSVETFDTPENVPEGTVVARVHFEDSNQTIVSYALRGQHSRMFTVDALGVVRVAAGADIDYEKSKVYHFSILAKNDVGNESYPVGIAITIINELDTPLFDVVVFEHVEENIPLGTEITTIRSDRIGLGAIEKFEILSPHIPFSIDSNGTIYVTDYLDYEKKKQYAFYAIARTKYGNSNKIEIHMVIDDQRPEIGIPILEDLTVMVDENAAPGSKIGQLVLDAGETSIERIALYGEDDNFMVDNNGSIYLASYARLDYESKTRYDLGARALNRIGYGNEVHIVIDINNIADELPTLSAFREGVEENATAGTVIGQVMSSGASELTISSFELRGEGSENFTIDSNGTIRVSETAQLDYESKRSHLLRAIASSSKGFSTEATVIIDILDVPETPPILYALKGFLEDNASIGTAIAEVAFASRGDSAVSGFRLTGSGAKNFRVDANEMLRVSDTATLNEDVKKMYDLKLYAENKAGESTPVSIQIVLTYDKTVPFKPGSLALLDIQHRSIAIGWTDNVPNEKGFYLYVDGVLTATLDTNTTSYRVRGLEEGTSYFFSLKAFNDRGESEASEIKGTTSIGSVGDLQALLEEKCGISPGTFDAYYNYDTGHYSQSIYCDSKGLTDKNLLYFRGLKSIGGNLSLYDNNLSNVDGLSALTSVGESLDLSGNKLDNVDGLSHLKSVEDFILLGRNKLTNVDGLSALSNFEGSLFLSSNKLENVDGLSNLKSVRDLLIIEENKLVDIEGLSNLKSVKGLIILWENKLTNVDGLRALSSVEGSLSISGTQITNLDALSNLTYVGDTLAFVNNPKLIDISGIENIVSSEGKLLAIDLEQYVIKAGEDSSFCTTTWDLWTVSGEKEENIADDMGKVCEGKSYVPNDRNRLRDMLGKRCEKWSEEFYDNYIEVLGRYNGDIACLKMEDDEMDSFAGLAEVNGSFAIEESNITSLDGLVPLQRVIGTLSIENNSELTDIYGLSNVLGTDGQKLIIDDTGQYDIKADKTLDFCATSWDMYAGESNISNNMTKVCTP